MGIAGCHSNSVCETRYRRNYTVLELAIPFDIIMTQVNTTAVLPKTLVAVLFLHYKVHRFEVSCGREMMGKNIIERQSSVNIDCSQHPIGTVVVKCTTLPYLYIRWHETDIVEF